jgi:Trypsin-like peptidase domain
MGLKIENFTDDYLVTAKHVVQGYISQTNGDVKVRINPKERATAIQQFTISTTPKPGETTWFYHPNAAIDVAIVRVNFKFLTDLGYEPSFFPNDVATMNKRKLAESEIAAGDGVFVLGFPMNLAGAQRNYVIVRQGVIARISEMLEDASTSFMIDSFVFPGNSGGPVILRPDLFAIQGTKSHTSAALIGVVTDYRPYTDVAISPQTNRARILFEENSGLADVLPIDFVEETIKAWRKDSDLPDVETTSSIPAPETK